MQNFYVDDEIDLTEFFSSIFRNRKIVGFLNIIFIFGFFWQAQEKDMAR